MRPYILCFFSEVTNIRRRRPTDDALENSVGIIFGSKAAGVRACYTNWGFKCRNSALTPCPLSRGAGEGKPAARRMHANPLSHAVGEGLAKVFFLA